LEKTSEESVIGFWLRFNAAMRLARRIKINAHAFDHSKKVNMKLLYILQVLLIHLAISFAIGLMTNNLTPGFWTWVGISIPFNLIFGAVIAYLPVAGKNKTGRSGPVENEEIFDHLFLNKKQNTNNKKQNT
jgi:hypothetical protein